MSVARKCDKCGNLYEPKNERLNGSEVFVRSTKENGKLETKTYDMCPNCVRDITNWITNQSNK